MIGRLDGNWEGIAVVAVRASSEGFDAFLPWMMIYTGLQFYNAAETLDAMLHECRTRP